MRMIVGLGNPGVQFRNTRHNLGFVVLDRLADRLGTAFTREKYGGLIAETRRGAEKILLVKPLTYVNKSGDCVSRAVQKKGLADLADLLVVVDDVSLPLGRIRLRAAGSAGGHNGLKSIIERLGSDGFPRLRMGVGEQGVGADLTGHVLGKFKPEERPVVDEMAPRAVDAVLYYLAEGVEATMTAFNQSTRQTGL